MKATISELWETGREIITFDDSGFERPSSFADLKKCDNVIIGDKVGGNMREVMIDNSILLVDRMKVNHPFGGTMYVLEVM